MDNLTHTLIGFVAGEAVARTMPADAEGLPDPARRRVLIAMGMIGGNLPDLDLAWSMPEIVGDKLGYLLHHRGHTHTVLGCLLLAGLLLAGVWLWLRWRRQRPAPADWRLFAGMALFAVLLHLGMDALNSYGVHPFWPWNNRWIYGDAVFIIEPLYWLATAPLLFALPGRVARVLLAVVALAATAALAFAHRGWLPFWLAPVPVVLVALSGWRRTPRAAVMTSVALMLTVTLGFALAGQRAEQRLAVIAARDFSGFTTLDTVLSPAPAHPLCWDVMLVQRNDDRYVVRQGRLSLLQPLDARHCPVTNLSSDVTAPVQAAEAASTPEMFWSGEFGMSRGLLTQVAEHDCVSRALMQFIRVPFVADRPGEQAWVLGDLRYDRNRELDFAEELVRHGGTPSCRYDLPWIAPRADLLVR